MNKKYYILRANCFSYNDEYYSVSDDSYYGYGKVADISLSHDAATKQWQQLELQAHADMEFDSYDFMYEGVPAQKREQLDAIFLEACGQPFYESRENNIACVDSCAELYEKIGPDYGLKFLQMAGICRFSLVQSELDDGLYVAKSAQSKEYIYARRIRKADELFEDGEDPDEDIYDETKLNIELAGAIDTNSNYDEAFYQDRRHTIVYACTQEELIGLMALHCNPGHIRLSNGLSSISDSPTLLESLIATMPSISYDQEKSTLTLLNEAAMKAVYPLLKVPPFLIEKVSPERLMEIQNGAPEAKHR